MAEKKKRSYDERTCKCGLHYKFETDQKIPKYVKCFKCKEKIYFEDNETTIEEGDLYEAVEDTEED